MKIKTNITTVQSVKVDITPKQAIQALMDEIVRSINDELRSLDLPKEELNIPWGGFHYFYFQKPGVVFGYHEQDRHPRETITDIEIKWGGDRLIRMVEHYNRLREILSSDTFRTE